MNTQERLAQLPTDRKVTFQQQFRACGKASCKKCKQGRKHGMYWYAFFREDGKLHSRYIGKEMPERQEEHHA